MKKLLLILGLSLGLATSVYANSWTGRMVLENKDMDLVSSYLNGVAQALLFANLQAERDGRALFCSPDRVALSGELAAEAIRTGGKIFGDELHPAVLALYGFKEMFPCR